MNEFPGNPELEIFAVRHRLLGAIDLENAEEMKRAALEIIVATHKHYSDDDSARIPPCVLSAKLMAHRALGKIALEQKHPEMAIQHFQQYKNVLIKMGRCDDEELLMMADGYIEIAKSMLPSGDKEESREKFLQFHRKLFKKEQKEGREHVKISSGCYLAKVLIDMNEFEEANSVLGEIHSLSKRVHGPEHPDTKSIETLQAEITARCNNLATDH